MSLCWVRSNNSLKRSLSLFRYIKLAILVSLKVGFSKLKYYIKAIAFTRNMVIIEYCCLFP